MSESWLLHLLIVSACLEGTTCYAFFFHPVFKGSPRIYWKGWDTLLPWTPLQAQWPTVRRAALVEVSILFFCYCAEQPCFNVMPTLYFWNKLNIIMIYYPSHILLMIYKKKKNLELIYFNALPVNKMKHLALYSVILPSK